MTRRAALVFTLLALLALTAPRPAHAQLCRWVNEQGEVHMTQGLENIHERFRAGAQLLGYPEAAPSPPRPAAGAAPASGPNSGEKAKPAPPTVWGGARIPFTPGSPILVTVRIKGRYVVLESLEVGDARVAPLGILAYDLLIREGDGLLGRDFLDLFKVNIDTETRVVVLSPR